MALLTLYTLRKCLQRSPPQSPTAGMVWRVLLFNLVVTVFGFSTPGFYYHQQHRDDLSGYFPSKQASASHCHYFGRTTPVVEATTSADIEEALHKTELSTQLPIFEILPQVRHSLVDRPNLLLEAPPGAGKTSIIPLALLTEVSHWRQPKNNEPQQPSSSSSLSNIIVVEPRRVAARSAAQRMSSILPQSCVGDTVGYAIRGDTQTSAQTRITCVTDGVLLNRLRDNPELTGIDAICFDEFHERGVGSDTALALCLEIQQSLRPDLRLIVMSATLFWETNNNDDNNNNNNNDGGEESRLFNIMGGKEQCNVLVSNGRIYPTTIQWAQKGYPPLGVLMKSRKDLVSTMCDAIQEALRIAPAKGDILAFLPGARDIERTVQELKSRRPSNGNNSNGLLEILPLYGTLPKDQQDYALYPSPQAGRRVIVSSPIAEASLTLERVTCVVDSGLRREPRCDVDTGMPRLVTTRCSKASARQRAGRAGRVQEGLCLRLYSQNEYDTKFPEHSAPEILNTDLVPTVLLLSDWGCSRPHDIYNIPFVDPPESSALNKAYETLVFLEALEETDDHRYIMTSLGRSITKIPAHPRLATTISRAESKQALAAAVISAAILEGDVTIRDGNEADLAPRIRSLLEGPSNAFATMGLLQYAARISEGAKNAVFYFVNNKNPSEIRTVVDAIGEALLPGFADLVAERKGDASYGSSTYMLSLGRSARLDGIRDSPDHIVVTETTTSDDGIARIRSFASISLKALHRVAKEKELVFTVPSRGYEVRARRSLMVGALELSSTPLPMPSCSQVTKLLLDTIRSLGGVHIALLQSLSKKESLAVDELRQRVRLAASLGDSSSHWPPCFAALDALENGEASPNDIQETEQLVEPWLAPAGSLKGVNMPDILLGALNVDQQTRLDRDFPVRIEAPDGTSIPIQYSDGVPKASAKLQQFFGTMESPSVGPPERRITVTLSLLSPAGIELAQTVDLPFFWKETYPSVRSEMRGTYAKHPWPEDPINASPTRQTKNQQAMVTEDNTLSTKKNKNTRRGRKRA